MKIRNQKTSNTPINQNDVIIKAMRKNHRKNFTTEELTTVVNKVNGLTGKRALTTTQVSKCLNRFSERNMVKKTGNTKINSMGRNVSTWVYASNKA